MKQNHKHSMLNASWSRIKPSSRRFLNKLIHQSGAWRRRMLHQASMRLVCCALPVHETSIARFSSVGTIEYGEESVQLLKFGVFGIQVTSTSQSTTAHLFYSIQAMISGLLLLCPTSNQRILREKPSIASWMANPNGLSLSYSRLCAIHNLDLDIYIYVSIVASSYTSLNGLSVYHSHQFHHFVSRYTHIVLTTETFPHGTVAKTLSTMFYYI